MQALTVIIPGDYWDVQIYRGRLHLWTMSGSLTTIHWDALVEKLAETAMNALAVRLGLARGAALYGEQIAPLRAEPEFREWMLSRFNLQASQTMTVDASQIVDSTLGNQDNPIPELPIDTEIYRRMLYAVTSRGIWEASVGRTVYPVSTRPRQLNDLTAVSIRAYSRQLALAATGDGLFKLGIGEDFNGSRELQQLSDRHCEKADWAFQSIFASSTLGGGYLYSRYWQTVYEDYFDDGEQFSLPRNVVVDGGVFDDNMIDGAFIQPDISWARSERIHTVQNHRLTSSRYVQKEVQSGIENACTSLGDILLGNEILLADDDDKPISGGSATFGTIVEFDDRLSIVLSDESQTTVCGPVTRWRTYPRSVNYENHLHVIFDDHLAIYAFYGDYFIDQRQKRFGIEYRAGNAPY